MNWRDLRLRVLALLAPRRVERELDDELAFHLEMETRKLVAAGLSPDDARARARARFGSPAVAAEECRDARGTTFVETCLQDAAYAVRGFRRAPTVALTIVGTVALGLGLVAAAFTVFNHFVFHVDAVRDPGELFAVERPRSGGSEPVRFTRPEYEGLRRDAGVFSDACAVLMDVTSRIDGRMMEGHIVTGNYFAVLGVDAAHGRTLTPADDVRPGRPVIVLSHSGWSRLFASDPSVLGRSVLLNGLRYEIVGVTPEGFRGLSFSAPDYWAPLSLVGQIRPWLAGREEMIGIDVIGRLKPGLSKRTALAGLAVWASGGSGANPGGPGGPNIRLQHRSTAIPLSPEALLAFSPLFFAFGLILMIGCANVANLLLARAVVAPAGNRHPPVARRLTPPHRPSVADREPAARARVGRLRARDLARHPRCGHLRAECARCRRSSRRWSASPRPARIGASWCFWSSPPSSRQASSGWRRRCRRRGSDLVRTVQPSLAMRSGASFASTSRSRNALIVVQVTASALLLICAGVFLRSAWHASTVDPGLRIADTIMVEINNEPFRSAMVAAVTAEPSVRAVAASWPEPLSRPRVGVCRASRG